jgi:hypothetical protein
MIVSGGGKESQGESRDWMDYDYRFLPRFTEAGGRSRSISVAGMRTRFDIFTTAIFPRLIQL